MSFITDLLEKPPKPRKGMTCLDSSQRRLKSKQHLDGCRRRMHCMKEPLIS